MNGYIRQIESFGTVDGPGIRLVVFFQGCPLRCKFCHNPETWTTDGGTEMSATEILDIYKKNKEFYSKGGITATGGEPLLQIDFLTELFQKAKKPRIHTCLDTSGIVFNRNNSEILKKTEKLLEFTDLVMLDIKHIDDEKHKELTGMSNKNVLDFARFVNEKGVKTLIRHVVVPGVTDCPDDLRELGRFIGELKTVKSLDVLAYHTLGVHKYRDLGIPYPLDGVPQASKEETIEARRHILSGIREKRG